MTKKNLVGALLRLAMNEVEAGQVFVIDEGFRVEVLGKGPSQAFAVELDGERTVWQRKLLNPLKTHRA